MTLPSSDIKKIGESVFGESTTTLPQITIRHSHDMSKKKFQRLIKRASQPLPKAKDKRR